MLSELPGFCTSGVRASRPVGRPVGRRTALRLAAGAALAAPLARSAAASPVTEPVERLYAGLLGIMKQGRATPFAQRFAALAPVVEQAFDLRTILEVSIGPRWAALPAEEQASVLDAYQRYTVSTYVANFNSFNGQRFEVLPTVRSAGRDQVVQSRIIPVDGTTREIDYAMRQEGGAFRIVDVLLDGSISRVAVQRSDFRSLVGSRNAAALLETLRRKTADLQGQS
jgi:phospholipid transport system substrate-binding protein